MTLICYHHIHNGRWCSAYTHWSLFDIIRAWRYGYRKFTLKRGLVRLVDYQYR